MLKPTRSYRGPLLNAIKLYLLVRKWVYPIHQLHFIIPAGFENTELLYSTNGHSESRCCVWFTAFRTLVCVHICKTMFISDYKSPLTSSQEQVKSSHSFDLITSAWYSEETPTTYSCSARLWWPSKWSGHMCGSALYEFLTVTEPGGGGFSRENRWAGKEGGSHQAERACWASPYGRMNYRRLAMLTVRRRHIISDWSFLYMTGVT